MSAPRIPMAIWLLPDDATRDRLQPTLDRLARRWDGPRFAAHVTLHVGDYAAHLEAGAIAAASLANEPAIALRAARCEASADYFRTLYLPLEGSGLETLRTRLLETLSGADAGSASATTARAAYRLEPHLSLLYARLDDATRARLLALERDPCRPRDSLACDSPDAHDGILRFDRIAFVTPTAGASDLSRVQNWQMSEALLLRG